MEGFGRDVIPESKSVAATRRRGMNEEFVEESCYSRRVPNADVRFLDRRSSIRT